MNNSTPKPVMTLPLTPREREVLKLASDGHTSRIMGEILCVSKRTVDFHLDHVYEKLKVSNRIQALRKAEMLGLLSDETPRNPEQAEGDE